MKGFAVAAFTVLLGLGCCAMDCDSIDGAIDSAFGQYAGRLGVSVQLLSVIDSHTETPPYEWIAVELGVAPVIPDPTWGVERWQFGGLITNETGPMPLGVRLIDRERLIPCSEIARRLPLDYRVDLASAHLFFPLVPTLEEPVWVIDWNGATFEIGAYTGASYMTPGG